MVGVAVTVRAEGMEFQRRLILPPSPHAAKERRGLSAAAVPCSPKLDQPQQVFRAVDK